LPLVVTCTLLVGGYLVLRHSVLGNLAGTDAAPGLPHLREGHRLLNAFRAWPEFVRLLFFPLDLTVDYAPAVILPVESWSPMPLLGAVLVFACAVLALATPQAARAGLVAGWFLISILPVANFFFPIGVLIAERTLYLPSVAVCFLAGFAWDAASQSVERETRRLALGLAVVVLGFFGVRTIVRNPDWDSLASVWKSLIRDHPESYRSQWLNALAEWNLGHHDLAERYFQIAYRIWPRDSQMVAEWGNFYVGQHKYDKAIALLEQSRDMTPFVPRTHAFLSYAYLYGGRPQEALETALHANQMEGAPTAIILPTIAGSYEKLGRYREAAEAWRNTVKMPGGDMWLNWAMLARAEAWSGNIRQALRTADVAVARTAKPGPSRTAAQKLKTAISDGCYRTGSACRDPLEGWQVTVATPTGGARSAP
jgi:protein O-mannosyl-transferase